MRDDPIAKGSFVAMIAAVLFGATTPLVAHFGERAGALSTATLLYAGAALGAGPPRRRDGEQPLKAWHAPRLAGVAFFGAALAPAALAWGLQRSGAVAGSLLLNLEALFTVALAASLYREPIGRRVVVACSLMLAGGGVLALRVGGGQSSPLGLLALTAATCFWALDNTLTRPLSDFDPRAVVFWKASLGAALSGAGAWWLEQPFPPPLALLGLLACGASGYGLSLRLYLQAQRTLGAARTGSLFALAPFVGALLAFAFGDRTGLGYVAVASALFGIAAYLHVTEGHGHRHRHERLVHEHPHTHDDGHHSHTHTPAVSGSHTHEHTHERLEHDHPHGSDLHHRHEHD